MAGAPGHLDEEGIEVAGSFDYAVDDATVECAECTGGSADESTV